MKRRVLHVVLQAADDRFGRRMIRVAHTEVDDIAAGGDGGLFLPVDLGKQIRRKLPQPL